MTPPPVWPESALASAPQGFQELARPSPAGPRHPLRLRAGGHFVGFPVVAAGAGRVPALGCGTACFSPIPERERLRRRCRARDLLVRQAHPRGVLTVTAGKVTRAAHRTRRTSRGMMFARLEFTPTRQSGLCRGATPRRSISHRTPLSPDIDSTITVHLDRAPTFQRSLQC
jgi:hypothetical protein